MPVDGLAAVGRARTAVPRRRRCVPRPRALRAAVAVRLRVDRAPSCSSTSPMAPVLPGGAAGGSRARPRARRPPVAARAQSAGAVPHALAAAGAVGVRTRPLASPPAHRRPRARSGVARRGTALEFHSQRDPAAGRRHARGLPAARGETRVPLTPIRTAPARAPQQPACPPHDARRSRWKSIPTAPASAIPAPAAGRRCCATRAVERELAGGEAHTTNNRMELMAAISGAGIAQRSRARSSCSPTRSTCARASATGCRTGCAATGRQRQAIRSRIATCGSACTPPRSATRSTGAG